MTWLRLAFMALIAALAWSGAAHAQTFTVTSIGAGNFGNIVAAPTGQSIFRASAATGTVTKLSGNAVRLSSASVRSLVTVACGNQVACITSNAQLTITVTGTPTGRAAALQNFTVSTSGATASIAVSPGTGSSITFQVGPVGRNASKTFWLGYDLPINGNNTAGLTGNATSNMVITVSRVGGGTPSSTSGTTSAQVFRGIAVTRSANLAFGRIVLPRSGSGTVSLAPTTGVMTVTGNGTAALGTPAPDAASFAVSGEGGQAVSISVPTTFTMTGGANAITVTTIPSLSGVQVLSGALGAAGSLSFDVGGSFPLTSGTPSQAYSGTFSVTVAYN
ncbi:DUF4402 domain-containing protein [Novosphingobium sp.]|uniref:DUF4402 domain-containing protein n=1 Tax=Novosphingobium sp. TaxID=1874826 RepID=UPI00286DB3EC|nr:DUF4402 domain-containing protein [Novosphingobium sp.]